MSLLRRTERDGHTIHHRNWEKACWKVHRRSWAGCFPGMKATGVGSNNFRDPEQRSIRATPPHLMAVVRSPRPEAHFVRSNEGKASFAVVKAARSLDCHRVVSRKADFRPFHPAHAAHCCVSPSAELTIAKVANSSMRANPWDANCSDPDSFPDHRNFRSRLGGVEPGVTPLNRFAVVESH